MSEKPWFIYIIKSDNGKLYTGITTDIERRLEEHKSGKKGAKFFNTTKAQELVYSEQVSNRSEASKREAQIKKLSRLQKLNLIDSDSNKQVK